MRICVFLLLLFATYVKAQPKVEYAPDFVFKEGVYLSFQDFKNNNLVPITHIVSTFDIRSADYLWQVLKADSITYYDNHLEERSIPTFLIWGFCSDNKIQVGINTVEGSQTAENRDWFPLMSIGAYSYFTAVIYIARFLPPTPGAMMPSGGISMYYDPLADAQGSYYQEAVPVQMLLDFSNGEYIQLATGDLTSISPKLMQALLGADMELLKQYNALSGHEQKQTSMFYIRKYNDRNPIYFPQ